VLILQDEKILVRTAHARASGITQTVGVKLTLIKSFRFKEWRAQGDDFRTFLNDFAACWVQIKLPAGLRL